MGKDILLSKYRFGRNCLITIVVFTTINVVMALFDVGYSLLFTAFVPQIAVIFAKYYFSGFDIILVISLFSLVPIALLLICFVLSYKDWKWMLVSFIIMVVDALALIAYSVAGYFDFSLVINYGFEICILYCLIRATLAGKELNNDFEGLDQKIIIDQSGAIKVEQPNTVKYYYYDKSLAKQNKTSKWLPFILALIGLVVTCSGTLIGLTFGITDGDIPLLIIGIVSLIATICLIIVENKLSVFVEANKFSFCKENDIVYRVSQTSIKLMQGYANLLVEKETSDAYYCSYINQYGKKREMLIPKCYPQIDEILF